MAASAAALGADAGGSTFDPCVSPADNPSLLSHVPVTVQVLDVNDNPPEVAADGEVIVCESSRPGQVSLLDSSCPGLKPALRGLGSSGSLTTSWSPGRCA